MVGLFTALGRVAGRVGTEAIDRKKEEVKAKREMQLQKLQQEFLGGQNAMQIASNEKLAGAQLAATKENTAAQLGVQERIATAGNRTTKEIAEANITSDETVAQKQINARADEIKTTLEANRAQWEATLKSEEGRSAAQIQGGKDLAKLQIDAAADANVTFQTQGDGTSVMLRNGKPVAMPLDPATGKPMNPAISDNDTPEVKNYKFMRTLNVPHNEAMKAFESKNDNPALLYAGYVQTFVKAQTTFGNATDETAENADRWARQMLENSGVVLPAAGAAPASAAAGATPVDPATFPPKPAGQSDDALVAQAKRWVQQKKYSADYVKQVLGSWNIDPATSGF
jgi:hypothetical protein